MISDTKWRLLIASCVVLLSVCRGLTPVDGNSNNVVTITYQEFVVEHEVSSGQARNAALSIDPDTLFTPLGCQNCSRTEMRYCEGRNVVHDHCCCDRRMHEELPYIPHTCYFGNKLCRPILQHCDEYAQTRRCCCDKHTLGIWKLKASAGSMRTRLVSELVVFTLAVSWMFMT